MSSRKNKLTPTSIILQTQAQILDIGWSDGLTFSYPSEYLRVYSPSTEVRRNDEPVHGKQDVQIEHIEPQGTYAIRIYFSDGHNTGIYSWDILYNLGTDYERNWKEYLEELEKYGLSRENKSAQLNASKLSISLHYYIDLQQITGVDSEIVSLPATVKTAQELVKWLLERNPEWTDAFTDDRVQITVNSNFIEPGTRLSPGDVVAFIEGDSF